MQNTEFILCPVCKNKTRLKMREDTILENFPLFCPKCKQETLISVKQLKITIHKEPDARTRTYREASRHNARKQVHKAYRYGFKSRRS